MDRRNAMKTLGLGFVAYRLSLREGGAQPSDQQRRCRIAVFGVDALRHDVSLKMWREGAPALSVLHRPICALSGGGQSVTQPGWIDIWSGLPAAYHGFVKNGARNAMPDGIHIMGKLMDEFAEKDFYAVWIVGKGVGLLDGEDPESPHHPVYKRIVLEGRPGIYVGDKSRSDWEVFERAQEALREAALHRNYCCFIHFHNPDVTGHREKHPAAFCRAALSVDRYISELMKVLPPDTHLVYCSDHGFNFKELGEVEDSHGFAPQGMAATSFDTNTYRNITRTTLGRWIYSISGGDPNHCLASGFPYAMYGVDVQ